MFKRSVKSYLSAESGVAAIEAAFIMPFLLVLYFGMIDITALISFNRKITYSASVMADLISQNRTTILKSDITDYYKAVDLIMAPTPASSVRVNLYGYRKVGTTPTQIWKTTNGVGPTCNNTPPTASMLPLMTADNDLVVAITCMTYTPYVATFLGEHLLGATSFKVEQATMLRPRSTTQLTCYQVSIGGAVCS